ncbi:TonB-dependent receptor [Crocinitomicaceae bacterium]|jgi:outer membrane receptor protein involved in Fe transport|nr:TonB-dependent receptor [Flavobacteriales bacterium]MDC3308956.1 TonB-dependent receptor [Crocinitomicaceae bacterium]
MSKYFSCILFLLIGFISWTQNNSKIYGKVTDESGEVLTGASVIYRTDVSFGSIADFDGKFELIVPSGKCKLICRYTGMKTDTLTFNLKPQEQREVNFTLFSYIKEFKEVDVKVGKFDKPIEEQTVSMIVIKPELIENKNTRSIETALDQTPGLNILDGEPQIRGGSGFTFGVGSKVAVIVDDMPMLSGDAGRPEWGFIPVENISQIEVVKGAASVLSGSSALSGSVNIRTAYPTSKPKTKINIYSGVYSKPNQEDATWWNQYPGIFGANFLHSQMFGNLDLVVGGNINYDHGYIGPPITDSIVATVFPDTITNFSESDLVSKRARVNFNLRYRSKKIKGLNYGLNGNFMKMHTNMPLAWLNDSTGLYRAYPGAIFLQDQLIFNLDPFVHFFSETNGKHYLRGRLLSVDNNMSANQSNNATTYYGDYMFKKKYKEFNNLEFVGGLTSTYTNSFSNIYIGSGTPNNRIWNVSAYTQLETKLKNILTLSAGGRLEYFQLNDTITALKPIFRAGSSLKIYQETYLRASYGQGYRFPTITERFIRTGVGNFGVFPNPNLLPESSWNAEVGIKQGLKFGGLYGYIDVAGFWQEYQNTIEYMFGIWNELTSVESMGSSAGFMFLNTGDSRVVGIDASFTGFAEFKNDSKMMFLMGYNYIVPKTLTPDYVYAIDSNQRQFSYNSTSLDGSQGILKYRFLHNVKLDCEYTWKDKLSVGASAKYFSKIVNMDAIIKDFEEFTTDVEVLQDLQYMNFYNSHRFGNWIFDARVSFNFNDSHKLALIGSNIFNRSYSLRPLKIEPPRTISVQYTYKLEGKSK